MWRLEGLRNLTNVAVRAVLLYCDADKLLGSILPSLWTAALDGNDDDVTAVDNLSWSFVDGMCGKLPMNIWNLPRDPYADWRTDSRRVEWKLMLEIVRSCRLSGSARSSYKVQWHIFMWSRHWRVCCLLVCLLGWLIAWLICIELTWLIMEVGRLTGFSTAKLARRATDTLGHTRYHDCISSLWLCVTAISPTLERL
jgi:hypothetical protein